MEQEAEMFGLLPGGDNYYSDDDDSDTSDEDRENPGSDDDDGNGVEVDPAVVKEIAKIPKANETERPAVSTLKTLCVVSICAHRFAYIRGDDIPEDVTIYKRGMLAISSAAFDKDIQNLRKCYQLADPFSYKWFPNFEREQFCIRELGIMIAFATFSGNHAAQLVASNMLSSLRQQDNVRTHRRFFYGIPPTDEANLAAIGQALVRLTEIKTSGVSNMFGCTLESYTSQDLPVREHTKAFLAKYFWH
jgi:hypothetical protein